MRTGLRNALVLSLLVAAAALTWYWSRPALERAGSGAESGAALGYYMLDGALAFTNSEGDTDVEIRFARLTEVPGEDRVVLDGLDIAQTLEDSAWRMSAERATGPADGSMFILENDVEVRLEQDRGAPYLLRMPRLELERAAKVARARGPIEVESGASRMTAQALEVDLNTRKLKLESVQGMRTSQITTAVATAALSAAAPAQDDAAADRERVTFSAVSSECAEECVFQGLKLSGDRWRLEAREARAAEVDALTDGEVRLTDVHFEFEDTSLDTPSAVFKFANEEVVEAALTGDMIRFDTDGVRFTAQRIVFIFDGGEPATVELSGNPAGFEDLGAERRTTVTAETISYDYGQRELRTDGAMTFTREGRGQLNCVDLSYDIDTRRFGTGECSGRSAQEDSAAAQGSDAASARDPAPNGTP